MADTGGPLNLEFVEAGTLTPDVPLHDMMVTINDYAIAYAGTYSSGTAYSKGHVVVYSNGLYRANTSCTGKIPGVDVEWDLWLIGATGPKGDPGDTGPTGATGATGSPGAAGDPFIINAIDVIANRSTYDAEAAGFTFLASDESKMYMRVGTSGWSNGVLFGTAADGSGKLYKDVSGSSDILLNEYESQCGNLEFYGTLTGNINVETYDNTKRLWRTYNSTTGSFTLTLKTSAGSGIEIFQGTPATVECDGTNVISADSGGSGTTLYTGTDSTFAVGDTMTVTHSSDTSLKRQLQFIATLKTAHLLMHMDGTNGGTIFTDEVGNTITPHGAMETSTSVVKFGTASAHFPSAGSYLSAASSDNYEFGSNNLTMEFWVKTANTTTFTTLLNKTNVDGFSTNGQWTLVFDNTGKVAFYLQDNSPISPLLAGATAINDNSWHHIAVVRNGSTWKLYIDGMADATGTYAGSIATLSVQIDIGTDRGFAGRDLIGYMDEVRIVNGTAKYTANFTPRTGAFTTNVLLKAPCLIANINVFTGNAITVNYGDVNGDNIDTKTTFTNNTTQTLNGEAHVII